MSFLKTGAKLVITFGANQIKEELKIAGKKNFHTDSIQSGGVRIFYKKKFRLNLLIIFASRTTDIWKETDKNRDNINSCFNFR